MVGTRVSPVVHNIECEADHWLCRDVKSGRMAAMKVSVVTPTFNYGRFLPKCLESVRLQVQGNDGLEIEHWVIDGGSTDGSVQFLQSWSASHPKSSEYSFHWISEPDHGQTDAINKGLRKSTGDLVCWLNADEYYLPGKLRIVARCFERNPRTDLLYGEALFVRPDGTPLRVRRNHWFSRFVLLYRCCYIPSCGTFWRRSLLESEGYLDERYKVVMDGEYWDRLAAHGRKFFFLPASIAAFIWHDENISTIFAEKRDSETIQNRLRYTKTFSGCSNEFRLRWFRFASPVALLWRRILVVFRLLFLPRDSTS